MCCPLALIPEQSFTDDLVSFIAHVESTKDVYELNELQKETLIPSVEVNGKVKVHKLDKILPAPGKVFSGFLK